MSALTTDLRRELERTVIKARDVAEKGARQALEALTVHEGKAGPHVRDNATLRDLRNRLRAHGRQLGDERNAKSGAQSIGRLEHECAYEHWHRMLFARFLAENDLLVEPESGVSVTLEEVEELAREARVNPWELASRYAQGALPQIFRTDDPVLAVDLPPETRLELEGLLEALPRETFLADDSLGWVYQFWQTEEKKRVNDSGEKITGDTLPAVTQLFTEHYMVLFLLHNTLGAWHAGKVLTTEDTENAETEEELRQKVALRTAAGDSPWTYLRFVQEESTADTDDGSKEITNSNSSSVSSVPSVVRKRWRPAAGTFDGWPREAKDLKVLDPCCGSGHFLVAAFKLLVRLRMHEEGLSIEDAACAVLRDNLFGLELDARCVQLAAFNVALAAWSLVGRRIELPELHIACCGIGPSATEVEWIKLAEESGIPFPPAGAEPIREGLRHLHSLFSKAPTLGSLIDPNELPSDMFIADHETILPYLHAAFGKETAGDEMRERAIAAAGMVRAAEILAGEYTLVATNVPFLGRDYQSRDLVEYADAHMSEARADLATMFLIRTLKMAAQSGTVALVTPQNWLFLTSYERLRRSVLTSASLNVVARLGANAFQDMNWWALNTALISASSCRPNERTQFGGIDVSVTKAQEEKAALLRGIDDNSLGLVPQAAQLKHPDARILLDDISHRTIVAEIADFGKGSSTGDAERFLIHFWELPRLGIDNQKWLNSPKSNHRWEGRRHVTTVSLESDALREQLGCWVRGERVWGRPGVAFLLMNKLVAFRYDGEVFDNNIGVLAPTNPQDVEAILDWCDSGEFLEAARVLDQKVNITPGTLSKVPFDAERWRRNLRDMCEPESDNPTQWLFHGRPEEAERGTELQIAVARLLGYHWPAELDIEMRLSKRARTLAKSCVELLGFTDADGIVCIPAVRGEPTAADQLRVLLAASFGNQWSADVQAELLANAECGGMSLDEWLRTKFFEQHCKLFHHRPFVWHIWDGRKDGFHALVNYHKLAAPDGAGRKLLESLTYSYLGDWINRQQAAVKSGEAGADGRLAAAATLKTELENILAGEPPYDLFVRWKPLHEQAIGWNPDINDGVRLNIRPFMMANDIGRKGAGILRFKPNCSWGPKADRGKEPESIRPREDFPWFWGWDEQTENFTGGTEFDGNRWNDLHYTNEIKQAARDRKAATDE